MCILQEEATIAINKALSDAARLIKHGVEKTFIQLDTATVQRLRVSLRELKEENDLRQKRCKETVQEVLEMNF